MEQREELLNRIKELAQSYTPEWRFNRENPDIGTALACVYGEMIYQTCKRLPLMMPKSQIHLYNLFSADLLPARASKGYVTFSLVNDKVPGVEVEKGTVLYGQYKGQRVSVETDQSLYVTPATIETVIQVDSDYIGEAVRVKRKEKIPFFDLRGNNRQTHILYLCHKEVFNTGEGEIALSFHSSQAGLLAREDLVDIFYSSKEGWQSIGERRMEEGILFLRKGRGNPEPAFMDMEGKSGIWIQFYIKEMEPFSTLRCKKITIRSEGSYLRPTAVYGAGIPCDQARCLPFGLEMGRFKEAAFASDEVLSKPGALVRFRFEITFLKTLLPGSIVREIEWKRVMKAKELAQPEAYDITVAEVIWEYFNGKGWNRLFQDQTGVHLFTPKGEAETEYRELVFECPEDLVSTTVDSVESYYIRARVLTMKNEYKQNGYYVTPVLSETTFSYTYLSDEIVPEWIITRNNLTTKCFTGKEAEQGGLLPFQKTQVSHRSVYLKLQCVPVQGPVKLLLQLEEIRMEKPYPLLWEYYSDQGFQKMEVTDETEDLRKTGLVTFAGGEDFRKTFMFEEEGYWIRISDRYGYYNVRKNYPVVSGIYMNTVSARAVQNKETQYFRMDRYEPDRQFILQRQGVLSSRLWVDEGESEPCWILWEERENFGSSTPNDRHYIIDANQGILRFGDGRYGKMPNISKQDNIKISYQTGGGEYTNIPAGTIDKMEKSIGFINQVTNPQEFAGGSDRETIRQALNRNGAVFKHRDRALTPEDYEELAMYTFPDIFRAACFSGYNSQGKREPGYLTLVVAQYNLKNGYLSFEDLKTRMEVFFRSRISCFLLGGDCFQIVSAKLVEINVKVTVMVKSLEDIFSTAKGIEEICREYFHPCYGNIHKKGWQIGEFPEPEQVKYVIGKEYGMIKKISFTYFFCFGNRKEETGLEKIKSHPFVLPISGVHQVVAEGGTHAAGY